MSEAHISLWGKFVDDGITVRVDVRTNKQIGDIVIAQHLDGVIYDCSIISQDKDYVYLEKLRVNELFYSQVQKAYRQYNLASKNGK